MADERLLQEGPQSVVIARLAAKGLKTVTAIASAYDDTYPDALLGIVSRKEFQFCIDLINQTLEDFYPCFSCYGCGYLCCGLTMGTSLCFPEPCTADLRYNLEVVLRRINNREENLVRGVLWSFQRSMVKHTSWIEISQIVFEQ